MNRRTLAVLLVLTVFAPTHVAARSSDARSQGPTVLAGRIANAQYQIIVPHSWNGTLFLYGHGYVPPDQPNPATAVPFSALETWLLGHGYAATGSSYS